MSQAMPLHAAAARLWLLFTLSCPVSFMWPPVVSDAVLCSPKISLQLIVRGVVTHVDPYFLLSSPLSGSMYISVVCYFGGIVRSSSDSDVQSVVAVSSVFCLLFQL